MNDFNYRWCLNEVDYAIICEMMNGWGMNALHRRMLSENGAIVFKEGVDICSGWLYQSDSKIAWIEWVVMNKKAPKKLREGAIDFLYETLFNKAEKLGYEVVMCIANHYMLVDKLKNRFGFIEDKEGGYQKLYFKKLWQESQPQ
jgi:hypothetical protein